MKSFLLIIASLIFLTSCQPKNESTEITSVNDLSQIDFNDVNNVLLDVRTPEEFKEGNIPNSVNYDFMSEDFDSMIQDLDPEKTYYVYCQAGGRSTEASTKMQQAGFKKVVNLKDGYSAYKK